MAKSRTKPKLLDTHVRALLEKGGAPDAYEMRRALSMDHLDVHTRALTHTRMYTNKKGEQLSYPEPDHKAAIQALKEVSIIWGMNEKGFDPEQHLRGKASREPAEFLRYLGNELQRRPQLTDVLLKVVGGMGESTREEFVRALLGGDTKALPQNKGGGVVTVRTVSVTVTSTTIVSVE